MRIGRLLAAAIPLSLILAMPATATVEAAGSASSAVSVATGASSYVQGDEVTITGRVLSGGTPAADAPVALEAEGKQSGRVYWVDQVTTAADGGFSDSFVLPKTSANDASVIVWASAAGGHAQASFLIQPLVPVLPGGGSSGSGGAGTGSSGSAGAGGGAGAGAGGSAASSSATISAQVGSSGGSLQAADGAVRLLVPPGAVGGSTTFSISEAPVASASLPNPQMVAASPAVTIGDGGVTLQKPLQISLQFSAAQLGGLSALRVGLFFDDGWEPVPMTVDATKGEVSANVSAAGTYAVFVNRTHFGDVPQGYWARDAIDLLLGRDAVSGFADGGFHPGATVTRAQFVKMLVLALGLRTAAHAASTFTDVPSAAWFAPYVAAAVQAKIVEGLTPRSFGPDQPITREQLAVMVARAMGNRTPEANVAVHFKDQGQIGAWALPDVLKVAAAGIVHGLSDGRFDPKGDATRAQTAEMLANLIDVTGL